MVNDQTEWAGEGTVRLLDPRGEVDAPRHSIAERIGTLEGACIGLLDNSKANAKVLLDEIGSILTDEYGVKETVYRRKDRSSTPADSLADAFHRSCDAVVNAYGDCGSCTSWLIYDSIELEKAGVPTATINSEEFARLGQSEARSLGMPGLPIVTVPHPMGGIPADTVRNRAHDVMPDVLEVLTENDEKLEAAYEGRYLGKNEELTDADLYCPID